MKYFKLQELVAHSSSVNCLAFGKKSGQVMVTGGDDKYVNMWRIGKPTNIMSLSGLKSAVECVTFDSREENVVAGSQGGSLKCFDLQEQKPFKTLQGHMSACSCVDYHPYGQFIASGSMDTNLKIWDLRSKLCIQTYRGHSQEISHVKFSPDGRWVMSGGKDGSIKLWDLTAGKLLHDFSDHAGPITSFEYNPSDFILATGSADKTTRVYDLETFNLIGITTADNSKIRSITHSKDGQYIFSSTQETVKVWSWEDNILCHEVVEVGWQNVVDTFVNDSMQLLGGSIQSSFISVWVVNLEEISPFNNKNVVKAATKNSVHGSVERKISSSSVQDDIIKPLNESHSDGHIRPSSKQGLSRSSSEKFEAKTNSPSIPAEDTTSSPSFIQQIPTGRPHTSAGRKNENKEQPNKEIKGLQEEIDSKQVMEQGTSMTDTLQRLSLQNNEQKKPLATCVVAQPKFEVVEVNQPSKSVISSETQAKDSQESKRGVSPIGLNFKDFAPKSSDNLNNIPLNQLLIDVSKDKETFQRAMGSRLEQLRIVVSYWQDSDIHGAIRHMQQLSSRSRQTIVVDFLRSLNWKNEFFNLEACVLLMPLVNELLTSDFEIYLATAIRSALKLFVMFSPMIYDIKLQAKQHPKRVIDISWEDRLQRCEACHHQFENLKEQIMTLKQRNIHASINDGLQNLQNVLIEYFDKHM